MVEQTSGLSTFSWLVSVIPSSQQHLHPWHLPSSQMDALLCQGRAPAAKAPSWGPVWTPAEVAACSQSLQGYRQVPFDPCEHCIYPLTPASGLPLPPEVMQSLAPAFWVPSSLDTHTYQGTCQPQQSTLGASKPQHHFHHSAAQLGRPPCRTPTPAAGRAPAQLPPQHCLLLLLLLPTTAREEKGSAEGGGHRAASRGQAFFGKQRRPLSAAAARPTGPDCTSVRCGAAAQSPSLLGECRAISRVTSLLRGRTTGGSPLLSCLQGCKTLHPHQQLELHGLNSLARSKGGCKRHLLPRCCCPSHQLGARQGQCPLVTARSRSRCPGAPIGAEGTWVPPCWAHGLPPATPQDTLCCAQLCCPSTCPSQGGGNAQEHWPQPRAPAVWHKPPTDQHESPDPSNGHGHQPPITKLSRSQSLFHVQRKPCINLSFTKGF